MVQHFTARQRWASQEPRGLRLHIRSRKLAQQNGSLHAYEKQPVHIVLDRDTRFVSEFRGVFCQRSGIKCALSAAHFEQAKLQQKAFADGFRRDWEFISRQPSLALHALRGTAR